MASLRFEASLAASTTLTNLLAGSKFEFLPAPSAIMVYGVQDGADAGTLTLDATFGNVIEGDNIAVPTFTAALGPDRDKHLLVSGVGLGGDRIQLKLVNADAVNAAAYRFLVIIAQQ
jgi:hypothetical protein